MASAVKEQFKVQLSPELKERLDGYAEMVGQSKASIVANAISDYLTWRLPQTADLKKAIVAADKDEFVSAEEVNSVFNKYEVWRLILQVWHVAQSRYH